MTHINEPCATVGKATCATICDHHKLYKISNWTRMVSKQSLFKPGSASVHLSRSITNYAVTAANHVMLNDLEVTTSSLDTHG